MLADVHRTSPYRAHKTIPMGSVLGRGTKTIRPCISTRVPAIFVCAASVIDAVDGSSTGAATGKRLSRSRPFQALNYCPAHDPVLIGLAEEI